ncbi:MAG TPA: hypothetical protein VGP25_04850 [Gemmatimonadaceae bacterium]|nr:hypothetical protein [Gemmatimonadaceae bacterium]
MLLPRTAYAQAQGTAIFTLSATIQTAVGVDCGAGVLNFGTISHPLTYAAPGTVTLAASAGAMPASSDGRVVLSGGSVLHCAITGLDATGAPTATVAFSGAGGTPTGGGLTGVQFRGLTTVTDVMLVNLAAVFVPSATASIGDVYVGGTITLKVGSATSAQVYASAPITMTITD